MRKRLLIVQPYVPNYRLPFFCELRKLLRREDIDMRLAAGRPVGNLAQRQDQEHHQQIDTRLPQRVLKLGSRELLVRSLRTELNRYPPDMIVVEQAIKNLETYALMSRRLIGGSWKIGMWGQGRTYSTYQHDAISKLKDWLTMRSSWFFSYTKEGARYLESKGFDPSRISVVNNSIDTVQLRRDLKEVQDRRLQDFREAHDLTAGRTALFLGGVDPDKGIDFLLETAKMVETRLNGFRLLVAGAGSSAELVKDAQTSGSPVVYLGRVEGPEKALALAASDILAIPQWVGLVAVDSLAAGRPIMTTRHHSHSPEFEYLTPGINTFVSEHDVTEYANMMAWVLQDRLLLRRAQLHAISDSSTFSIEAMASSFSQGVLEWIQEN